MKINPFCEQFVETNKSYRILNFKLNFNFEIPFFNLHRSISGANFGTVISLPLSGWLCSLELWGGWPLAFYLFGSLGIVWYVFWLFFIYDTPALHPRIDTMERLYIEACVEPKDDVGSTKILFKTQL